MHECPAREAGRKHLFRAGGGNTVRLQYGLFKL